jgi:hypothetical protein
MTGTVGQACDGAPSQVVRDQIRTSTTQTPAVMAPPWARISCCNRPDRGAADRGDRDLDGPDDHACRSDRGHSRRPLQARRDPIQIAGGFAGIAGMDLLLVQPLLAGGYLAGPDARRGAPTHVNGDRIPGRRARRIGPGRQRDR